MPVKCLFGCMCLLAAQLLCAQSQPFRKWWVTFSDKKDSPFCTCRPAEFLSARALDRRARAGIPVEENDLPVNPQYIQQVVELGAQLHNTSRWLNAVTVIADSATAGQLRALPFVRTVQNLGPDIPVRNPANRPAKKRTPLAVLPKVNGAGSNFGYAGLQNSLLGIPFLHASGHRGQGIWVVVMDGGFQNVDTLPFFDSAALQARLYQGWDFVERDSAVYESATHGTAVLSVMAGDLPGYFVGTAPEATYFLVKTEDTGGEFPVEEANWIAGAEWADSIGADMINASLGYTVFNDTTLGHRYSELDGRTAIGSRGAAVAATKGMIICNSAGNSGQDAWTYLGVPADAAGIIAVGAVQHDGQLAPFSSLGPTADGRIKPDLVAPGDMVVVAGSGGTDLEFSSGTSLASPMLTGAIASLWSAFPDKRAAEILEAVFSSADLAGNPDNKRGYGLPDMTRAQFSLGGYWRTDTPNDARAGLFSFDRQAGRLSFLVISHAGEQVEDTELRNAVGEKMETLSPVVNNSRVIELIFNNLYDLPPGDYQVLVRTTQGAFRLSGLAWH